MRLPSLLRRTPFRLTLLFLALFVAAAGAILAYVYFASASEAQGRAQAEVEAERAALTAVYRTRGLDALNQALVERTIRGGPYLYLLTGPDGRRYAKRDRSVTLAELRAGGLTAETLRAELGFSSGD